MTSTTRPGGGDESRDEAAVLARLEREMRPAPPPVRVRRPAAPRAVRVARPVVSRAADGDTVRHQGDTEATSSPTSDEGVRAGQDGDGTAYAPGVALEVDDDTGVKPTWRARRVRHQIRHHGQMAALLAAGDPREWTADVTLDRKEAAAERELRAYALAHRPDLVAVRAERARRRLVALLIGAMIGGLAWSTVTVHAGFTHGAEAFSPAWFVGWLIEPSLACVLIGMITAMQVAQRLGIRIPDEIRSKFRKVEFAAFSVTATLSLYPLVDGEEAVTVGSVAHHIVGPLIAILAAFALGAADALFAGQPYPPLTPRSYRDDAAEPVRPVRPAVRPAPGSLEEQTNRVRAALAGKVLKSTSANSIRSFLGCGMDRAREIRNVIETEG